MPLYIDIHLDVVSVEDTRKAHMADLAVREKYVVNIINIGLTRKQVRFMA